MMDLEKQIAAHNILHKEIQAYGSQLCVSSAGGKVRLRSRGEDDSHRKEVTVTRKEAGQSASVVSQFLETNLHLWVFINEGL